MRLGGFGVGWIAPTPALPHEGGGAQRVVTPRTAPGCSCRPRRLRLHRAGGRLDFLGYSKARGGWGIGDYKTSSGFYGNEYAYQAGGGYALMVEEMYGIEIKWAEIVRFSKKSPYESEARPVLDIRASISGFLAALNIVRSNEIKLIGAPTFTSAGVTPTAADETIKAKKAAKPSGLGF